MRSHRAANQPHTSMKLYVRSILCFSPDRTPGVSTRVTSSSSLLAQLAASNLARKPFPYCASPYSTTRELVCGFNTREKKRTEKTTPSGVNLMRSQVLHWAVQAFQHTTSSLKLNFCGTLQLMLTGTLRLKSRDNSPTCFVRASAADVQSCLQA